MKKKTELTESQKITLVADIFPKGAKGFTKTGMLSVALEKIRSLKAQLTKISREYSDLTARLMDVRNRCNDEVSGLVAEREGHEMKIRALQSEIGKLVLSSEQSKYLLKQSLAAEKQRADDLYAANQKFAEDDHEYRLSTQAAQNRLVNDNLHQSEEIDRLNKSVAEWVKNPVNAQLEEQVKHLDVYARTLKTDFDQALLVGQRQIEMLQVDLEKKKIEISALKQANEDLCDGAESSTDVLTGEIDDLNFKLAEAKVNDEKVRIGALRTNEICKDEINKRDLKIANLQQRSNEDRESSRLMHRSMYERIEELLLKEKKLQDEVSACNKIIELAGNAHGQTFNSLSAARQEIEALRLQLSVHEIRTESKSFARIVRDRIAACKSCGPSPLSKFWQWLNSPY